MKTLIKITLTLLSFSGLITAQNSTKTDTIKWSSYQMIIELPSKSHSHSEPYEEGFFRTISCFLDSAVITIHCGAMVNLPLIDLTKYTITSKFILDKDVRVLRGCCDYINNGVRSKRFFREENYFRYGITVQYESVSESKLTYYDYILNNIKVIDTRR